MSNQSASEWLRNQGVSHNDLDFIESVLTFTSAAKGLPNKIEEINQTLRMSFPDKKAEIFPELTFSQFEKMLQDNELHIDLNEMLMRYKAQGLCADLCNQLLERQLDR